MIRVAHLTFSGAFGGREKVAFSLVSALSKRADSSLYLVLEDRAGKEKINELLEHLSLYTLKYKLIHTEAFFSIKTLKELAAHISEDRTEILHAHCHKSLTYAIMLKYFYRADVAVTATLHGLKIPFGSKFILHHILNLTGILFSDAIIGCSREIVATIQKVPILKQKVTVIRNNITIESKALLERDVVRNTFRQLYNILDHKICWVGNASRLTAQKNIPLYLEAVRKVSDEFERKDVIFLLAGDGELKDQVLNQAKAFGLSDSFCFVGFLTNMSEFYHVLDLFVLTSDWEGTPMALLEAMSQSLPVVASSVGGVPDVVIDGVTGRLFPKGDLNACVMAMRTLLEHADLMRSMGHAGKQRIADEFTEQRWVNEHMDHYHALLNRKGVTLK